MFIRHLKIYLLLPLFIGISFYFFLYTYFLKPIEASNLEPVYIVNYEESDFSKFAKKIAKKGLVKHWLVLDFIKKYDGYEGKIKEGEYSFSKWMTPVEVYKTIILGKTLERSYKIKAGAILNKIFLEISDSRSEFVKFKKIAFDKKVLNSLGVMAPSLEGYVGPGEIKFSRSDSKKSIILKMYEKHDIFWKNNFANAEKKTGLNKNQILTIASILIKEGVLKENMEEFLAKLKIDLKKNIPLKLKSSLRYAFGYRRNLDGYLDFSHPFNTFINIGLPPGPICVPRKDYVLFVINNWK